MFGSRCVSDRVVPVSFVVCAKMMQVRLDGTIRADDKGAIGVAILGTRWVSEIAIDFAIIAFADSKDLNFS
jgi:hypothetical protein